MKETKKEYVEKYKDPRWQRKRLEILERDGWQCQSCGTTKETLHIHHTYYEKDKNPWDYKSCYLITLCSSCHEMEFSQYNDLIDMLKERLGYHLVLSDEVSLLVDIVNKLLSNYGILVIHALRSMLCQINWEKEQEAFDSIITSIIRKYKDKRRSKV